MEWGAQREAREKSETGDRVKERNQRETEREITERKKQIERGETGRRRVKQRETF